MSSERAFSGASISRSRFRAIQRVSVDRPTPRFSANSRRVRPLVRARRTASSSNSCVNPFCFVIEFTFHPRKTLHFFAAKTEMSRHETRREFNCLAQLGNLLVGFFLLAESKSQSDVN